MFFYLYCDYITVLWDIYQKNFNDNDNNNDNNNNDNNNNFGKYQPTVNISKSPKNNFVSFWQKCIKILDKMKLYEKQALKSSSWKK